MQISQRNLNKHIEQKLIDKFQTWGFCKKGDLILKNLEEDMVLSFHFSICNYGEAFDVIFSFWYGNIICDKIYFVSQIEIGEREIEEYKSSKFFNAIQIKEGTAFLNDKGLFPDGNYLIWNYEQADVMLKDITDYLLKNWIPYVENLNNLKKLEYEVNEGRHFQLQMTPSVISENKSIHFEESYKILGLILAKMVSEEMYQKRREFYITQQIKEDEMRDYEPDNTSWYNFIKFMDNNSKESLLNLVEEYDGKYLKNKTKKKAGKTKEQIEEEIAPVEEKDENVLSITGFDSDGEPEIRKEEDGSLTIAFNFMPPLNGQEEATDDPVFENFDKVLSEFLGVEVEWDDREFFRIEKPKEDTIEKIKDFLGHFWDKYYDQYNNPAKKKKKWWSF